MGARNKKFGLTPLILAGLMLTLFSATPSYLRAQIDVDNYRYQTPEDSTLNKRLQRWRARIRPTEKFDLVWNKGFLVTTNMPDSIPLKTVTSGTNFIGVSLNYQLAKRFMCYIQPGFSFFKMNFDQTRAKTYPTPADSQSTEKILVDYFEMPIGVALVLQRDEERGRNLALWEIGGSFGYLIGSSYKTVRSANGRRIKSKINAIPDLEPFRIGVYSKLTYRFVGIWAYYRLNEVFKQISYPDGTRTPKISRFEIGFSVIL